MLLIYWCIRLLWKITLYARNVRVPEIYVVMAILWDAYGSGGLWLISPARNTIHGIIGFAILPPSEIAPFLMVLH